MIAVRHQPLLFLCPALAAVPPRAFPMLRVMTAHVMKRKRRDTWPALRRRDRLFFARFCITFTFCMGGVGLEDSQRSLFASCLEGPGCEGLAARGWLRGRWDVLSHGASPWSPVRQNVPTAPTRPPTRPPLLKNRKRKRNKNTCLAGSLFLRFNFVSCRLLPSISRLEKQGGGLGTVAGGARQSILGMGIRYFLSQDHFRSGPRRRNGMWCGEH